MQAMLSSSPAGWLALAAFAAVVLVINLAMWPLRTGMVAIAENLLSDKSYTEDEHRLVDHVLDTAFSFRVGFLIPVAAVAVIADILLGTKPEYSPIFNESRFVQLFGRYVLSILAVNPLMAFVSIPLILIGSLFQAARNGLSPSVSFEGQAVRASLAIS